jgi:hypothetical protein
VRLRGDSRHRARGSRHDGGNVGVQIFDATGAPADIPFHVIVPC